MRPGFIARARVDAARARGTVRDALAKGSARADGRASLASLDDARTRGRARASTPTPRCSRAR